MKIFLATVLLSLVAFGARADIYKHVDADGRVTYSNVPMKGAKKLDLGPYSTPSLPRQKTNFKGPADFPRVDGETQKKRDEVRRRILTEELGVEQERLAEAKKARKEGEENPETFTGQDGKTYRNVAKYEEKIKRLREEVTLHEKNVDALKKELSGIR